MRIGLITRRFDPDGGGTERDLTLTAAILARAGHQVMIYANEIRRGAQPWPVKMVRGPLPGRTLQVWWFARKAAAEARRDGAELVLSFARVIGADILRSGGGAHASYIRAAAQWQGWAERFAMRLNPYHRVQMAIERAGFRHLHLQLAIAVSKLVTDDLVGSFDLPPERVVTVYNGVDCGTFKPALDSAERNALRQRLGLPDDACVVLFVGSGFGRKGLGFLIEAWKRLNGSPYLLVAGGDRAAKKYQRLVMRHGVGDRVRFLGRRDDVPELMRTADAFALPSLFEPFGNVALEAMASGLPVLTTLRCGVAEVVPDELRSLVVADPTNVRELAAKMQALIEAPSALGETARAAAEQFTWERHASELLALIEGRHG
ncbi:MAG TPA: glycosyltransferase family 4 protein [Candidatus Binataceae bacterium]|nr:glycosyltransferase family 4 protein [Candidatus Binataceae bacterium]